MLKTVRSARVIFPSHLRFASSSKESRGPNEKLLAALRDARTTEMNRPDRSPYALRSLSVAMKEIEYLDHNLSEEDVKQLKGFSQTLKKFITDFVRSQNSLLDHSKDSPVLSIQGSSQRARDQARSEIVEEIQSVPSIGLYTARHLVSNGVTSIKQLKELLDSPAPPARNGGLNVHVELTKLQRTNLKYYDHIMQPVTRSETERVCDLVKEILPSGYQALCVGAYRREFPISQRVDLCLFHPLVTQVPKPSSPGPELLKKPDHTGRIDLAFGSNFISRTARNTLLLKEVVPLLRKGGLIAHGDLVEIRKSEWKWAGMVRVPEEGESKADRWMANSEGKGTYRILDLNLVPSPSTATALSFLTGDVEFVRDLRMRAHRMGLLLNEFGLWRWEKAEGSEGHDSSSPPSRRRGRPSASHMDGTWVQIPTPTEMVLFEELGIGYVHPDRRNYTYLVNKYGKTVGRMYKGGDAEFATSVVGRS